jgi:hypothetical protein
MKEGSTALKDKLLKMKNATSMVAKVSSSLKKAVTSK